VDDPNPIEAFGAMLSDRLVFAYIGFFILFAAVEAVFGMSRDPASAARGRIVVNFSLPIVSALIAAIVPFGVTTSAILAAREHWRLFNQIAAPPLAILAVALVARTGLGYLVHRLSHAVPLLWRLHKIHHSDPHVDVSLSLRHHPLELLPGLAAYSAGTILLGLPVWAVALVEALLIGAGYCDHLDVRLPPRAARLLAGLFVTPDVHRLHHSAERVQTDSNYGSLLIAWDRLFGTFRAPEREVVARYGLEEVDAAAANSLWAQLILPFRPVAPGRRAGAAEARSTR